MTIRLFCVAGMLCNTLVSKMKDAAKLKELEVDIQALPESKMTKSLEGVDVVLLGPQIAYRLRNVKSLCEPLGIASSVIPMLDFGMMNGAKILNMAINLVEEMKEKLEHEAIEEKEAEERAAQKAVEQEIIEKGVAESTRQEAEEKDEVEYELEEKKIGKDLVKRLDIESKEEINKGNMEFSKNVQTEACEFIESGI